MMLLEPYTGDSNVKMVIAIPVAIKYTIDLVCVRASMITSGDNYGRLEQSRAKTFFFVL